VFGSALQPGLEKITGRIAVSAAARRVVVEHLGGDAVLIPNGVAVRRFEGAIPLPTRRPVPTVAFLGRIDEPRKGLAVLLEALPELVELVPDVCLLVAGPGDVEEVRETVPASLRGHVELLGLVSDADKPRVYASGDVYCAPNTHGESFGIVLIEAMATGTPVVASDLEAFRRVLEDGRAGVLVPVGDPASLASALADLLADADRRKGLAEVAREVVEQYDWSTVTRRIVEVYETVVASVPVDSEFAVDVDHAVDDFADDLAGDTDDDPSRLMTALRRWFSRSPSS
jgi:phosphatidylinositol alpha-mannosyltransferase